MVMCYITANKTFDSLRESFKKNKVKMNNFVFIDIISKSIKKVSDEDNVYYVSSPGALTELSLVIQKFLKYDFNYLIFDSVTNLETYQKKEIVLKFIIDLINKIRKTNTKSVLYVLDTAEDSWLVNHISSSVDKVLRLDKLKIT